MNTAQLNAVRQIADKMQENGITFYSMRKLAHSETVAIGGFVYECGDGRWAAVPARSIHIATENRWLLVDVTW